MSAYKNFAALYDLLTTDIDYKAQADFLETLFKKFNLKPNLILDAACGTGSTTLELSKRGYEMIGIDLSIEMLNVAKEKALQNNADILFLNQDITSFELYGTVDAIICLTDSLNYITKKADLKKFFSLVKNYLNPGGLLIFDINSEYKIKNILGNNVFSYNENDIFYTWQNNYNNRNKLCDFYLTFFVKEGDSYFRFDEFHTQRAYSVAELKTLVNNSGLSFLGIFDDQTLTPPKRNSERIFFAAKRID